jgi:hypothetical protein
MNRRPKQISVPIETGEGKVSEKRVREAQFWALGFSGNRRKGSAVENLAGELKTETVRYKLSVAREFKMEIPANLVIVGSRLRPDCRRFVQDAN